jgi:hypothetical protein
MKAYPDLRFFSNGAYIPFDAIRDLEKVKLPAYVNEPPTRLIRNAGAEIIRLAGRDIPVEKGFAGFLESASRSGNTVTFTGWAIDETGGRPASEVLVFVGDTLWSPIWPGVARSDLAGFGKAFIQSGFDGLLHGVPPAELKNVRAFALLADGTARELRYSAGYPFATDYGPGPEHLRAPRADGPPTVYLHDESAIVADIPGREEKLSWSVIGWTPDQYSVRVVAPSDGYLLNLGNYNRYWKAYVDGRRQDILRANFTMQAIKLAKGEHIVEWRYDPLPFKLGWLAFYAVFAAVSIAFAFSGLPRHRSTGVARG